MALEGRYLRRTELLWMETYRTLCISEICYIVKYIKWTWTCKKIFRNICEMDLLKDYFRKVWDQKQKQGYATCLRDLSFPACSVFISSCLVTAPKVVIPLLLCSSRLRIAAPSNWIGSR
jgi:hypothetical protein